jgi:glycine cleavage system regulatory protein
VLDDHLGQMWVYVCWELKEDILRELCALLQGVGWQIHLLQRKAIEIAVHDGEGLGGQVDRESCLSNASDHRVVAS